MGRWKDGQVDERVGGGWMRRWIYGRARLINGYLMDG